MLYLIRRVTKITHILQMFQKTDPWVYEQLRNCNRSVCDEVDESNLHYQATERENSIEVVCSQIVFVL